MAHRQIELILTPQEAFDSTLFHQAIAERLRLSENSDQVFQMIRRSIDARSRKVVVKILGEVVSREEIRKSIAYERKFPMFRNQNR